MKHVYRSLNCNLQYLFLEFQVFCAMSTRYYVGRWNSKSSRVEKVPGSSPVKVYPVPSVSSSITSSASDNSSDLFDSAMMDSDSSPDKLRFPNFRKFSTSNESEPNPHVSSEVANVESGLLSKWGTTSRTRSQLKSSQMQPVAQSNRGNSTSNFTKNSEASERMTTKRNLMARKTKQISAEAIESKRMRFESNDRFAMSSDEESSHSSPSPVKSDTFSSRKFQDQQELNFLGEPVNSSSSHPATSDQQFASKAPKSSNSLAKSLTFDFVEEQSPSFLPDCGYFTQSQPNPDIADQFSEKTEVVYDSKFEDLQQLQTAPSVLQPKPSNALISPLRDRKKNFLSGNVSSNNRKVSFIFLEKCSQLFIHILPPQYGFLSVF